MSRHNATVARLQQICGLRSEILGGELNILDELLAGRAPLDGAPVGREAFSSIIAEPPQLVRTRRSDAEQDAPRPRPLDNATACADATQHNHLLFIAHTSFFKPARTTSPGRHHQLLLQPYRD